MEKTINIFGDSITWGAYDEKGGWADRLKNHLMDINKGNCDAYNLGVSGDNSEDLLQRFPIENEARNPDVIIVAIGTNDACYLESKKNNYVPLNRFEVNLEKIIELGKKYSKRIVFIGLTNIDEKILNPVPWATDFYCRKDDFQRYDKKIREIAERNRLLFVDMMDVLEGGDLEDGLHPNSQGHEKMFLRIKDFLEEQGIV